MDHIICTVPNCKCAYHAAAIACASAGTTKGKSRAPLALSASERRARNPFMSRSYEELMELINKKFVPKTTADFIKINSAINRNKKLALHAILTRFPCLDIEVLERAQKLSTNQHEIQAIKHIRRWLLARQLFKETHGYELRSIDQILPKPIED